MDCQELHLLTYDEVPRLSPVEGHAPRRSTPHPHASDAELA